MRYARAALITTALALLALLVPAAASATEPEPVPMQELVDEVINEHGGEQTGWNEVTWDGGDVVLTIDPGLGSDAKPTTRALAAMAATDNCTAGKYCAYANAFYGGSKLTYSACPATQTSFGAIGSVRSIKNDRTSGTVKAYNGRTVKATLSPGKGNSNISGITKITCT